MISYGRGEEDAAMEYVAPPRDKGTRMLKLGDELWIYMPNVDRVQKISGHMLRQGMMGSDLSYEDMMASRQMRKQYTAKVTGEQTVDGRACWTLEMIAKSDSVTYPKRVTAVDKQTFIPLKQELYALSGMLLKTWSMSDVKEFPGGRKFPSRMTVQDHVKKQSITTVEFKSIEFGIDFPREVFSVRWLERR
jgi:outer membrane lipoprotein-sorting protein